MMMGVVKIKQETCEAKASAEAQRKDAQEALAHAAAARRSELQVLHAQMTKLADKMLEDEEAMECSVCLETGASTALIPCGHCFCCRPSCASHTVDVCPSCRAPVKSRTVLFGAHAPTSQYPQIANLLDALSRTIYVRSASQPPAPVPQTAEGGQGSKMKEPEDEPK
eukprot:Tamp_34776.p1 GENE.Tamp_34776~~Tamp_34776.p1  ORF type:complete len:167 (-),score=28.47 Tamp_34776:25-525(-)